MSRRAAAAECCCPLCLARRDEEDGSRALRLGHLMIGELFWGAAMLLAGFWIGWCFRPPRHPTDWTWIDAFVLFVSLLMGIAMNVTARFAGRRFERASQRSAFLRKMSEKQPVIIVHPEGQAPKESRAPLH